MSARSSNPFRFHKTHQTPEVAAKADDQAR